MEQTQGGAPWKPGGNQRVGIIEACRRRCKARFDYHGPAAWCDLIVEYFDQNNGASRFAAYVGDQLVDEWVTGDHLPSQKPDGSSATCRVIHGLALRPGDEIRIEGTPDGHLSSLTGLDTVVIRRDKKLRSRST